MTTQAKTYQEMITRASRLLEALKAIEPGELSTDRAEVERLCRDVETGARLLRQNLDIDQNGADQTESHAIDHAAAKGVIHRMIDEIPYTAEDLMFINVILAGFWSVPPAALFQQLCSAPSSPIEDETRPADAGRQ